MANRRNAVASLLERSGVLALIEQVPRANQLLVVNYHRIGDRHATCFDPEVFSASQDTLADQIAMFRRKYALVCENEALHIIEGRSRSKGTAILLTFDDGYLDNLELAVPVLQAHGATALFFLVTSYLSDPGQIPWWDRIAWLVRKCEGRRLSLSHPTELRVDVNQTNLVATIREVLSRYRSAPVTASEALMAELEAAAGHPELPGAPRLLMGWAEARRLRDAGMGIGLHSHSHRILAKLGAEEQHEDLSTCLALMRSNLGIEPKSIAYPVGSREAFTAETKSIVKGLALRAAFSFHGGINIGGSIDSFDVKRVSFSDDAPRARARAAVALMSTTRRVWL